MDSTKKCLLIIAMLSFCFFPSCKRKASDEIGYGTFEGHVYKNKYFDMAITIPDDWSIQDRQTQKEMMDAGKNLVAGDDKDMRATLKASELQSVTFCTAFKHPPGTPVKYNPGIIIMAERVKHLPGIKRGKDYLFHAKKVMETTKIKYSFPGEITTEVLDGVEFDIMPVDIELMGLKVSQKYYVTIMKKYALCAIISYTTDAEKEELSNILKTMTFVKNKE